MGNTCSCEANEKIGEFFIVEFNETPIHQSLRGTSLKEESFVKENLALHNTNFSKRLKSNDRSKSINSDRKSSKKNSESHQISLFRSVQEYSKGEDNCESILVEGELLKYRPGISQEYTARWCRLTTEGFAYYKNQWSATCANKTPLAFIPLYQIKEVTFAEKTGKKKPKLFEFEIFLLEEDELTKLSRSTNGFTLRPNENLQEKVPANWWSVRQVEWYSAERRLLFASPSQDFINNWVLCLKKSLQDLVNL